MPANDQTNKDNREIEKQFGRETYRQDPDVPPQKPQKEDCEEKNDTE